MTAAPTRGIFFAALIAIGLHALLFLAAPSQSMPGRIGVLAPPATRYLARAGQNPSMTGPEVRTVKSPVVFSLPSGVGFSGDLARNDVERSLLQTFPRTEPSESFLPLPAVGSGEGAPLVPRELMVSAGEDTPDVPSDVFQSSESRPAARRITLDPALKARLLGGVVLPAQLNKEVEKPWEVRAAVTISDVGIVQHVFLDAPLESAELNAEVLQLLRGLRFKPGEPMEGSIEIYSPGFTGNGGGAK